ncbi:DUF5709 domain-containing protein [Actinophytocola algeriensis]|jgi:hypothetical protein|uniref:DUF5709 domain-containing protein n=1 Tax=Actinophytocola algeriensis TaxID=1768010 RepID=A0A7W7Q9I1_9PSEU|nr:DUF5709 domain-containing protein [Actinophytocola algeriensis]MBB4909527.1 hypothetical protein [Actinophytocola algeriensis]MBE1475517.1 hypothetical protein [Actinophytocola algeriensis]
MRDDIDSDSDLLPSADTLVDRGVEDVLDEGYSPAERPSDFSTEHEALDARLSRELPEGGPEDGDGLGDASDTDGELYDDEVGVARSGRLVAEDEGASADADAHLYARDVGIDGAAASSEEAAVHVVPDEE